MPIPKLDDNLLEYSFSNEEYKVARALNPLQIALLHTKRAQFIKLRASIPIPEDINLNRSYITQCCEIDGKIAFIQELLDEHTAVIKELSDPNKSEIDPDRSVDNIASRASKLVNQT